jgi:hypothetical protein
MNSSVSPDQVSAVVPSFLEVNSTLSLDLAVVGKKVVDFYKKKGIPVVSPLDKAIHL